MARTTRVATLVASLLALFLLVGPASAQEASPGLAAADWIAGELASDEPSFDESEHARRVAEHFGTDHTEDVFTSDSMIDLLPTIVDVLDEPLGDASILPTYLLSRHTRASVTDGSSPCAQIAGAS